VSKSKQPTPPKAAGGSSPAGAAKTGCPPKLIEVHWAPREAMCGDPVRLIATAQNMPANTSASGEATITTSADKKVMTESSTGQSNFNFPNAKAWEVKEVVFSGSPLPLQHKLKGKATAAGQTVETKPTEPLIIKRIPDKELEQVSTRITSGVYGWDAIFKIGFKDNTLTTFIQMQYKKSWKGQWVTFDSAQDGGKTGWAYVKKVGTAWKYWNKTATTPSWVALPRAISNYTVNTIIFIKDGTSFKSRSSSQVWPEAFPESPTPSFDSVKNGWLANIHKTWDGKFKLHRKGCPSSAANCCTWPIKVQAKWDTASGQKLVYLIWTQQWAGTNDGRSNAQDWYIGDGRTGLAPHEFGHLLGAYDEYTGGAVDPATNKIDANTIMGQNLPLTAKKRHMDNWRKQVRDKIRTWTGHSQWDFEVQDV